MKHRIVDLTPPPDVEQRVHDLARFVGDIFAAEHPGVIGAALVHLVASHIVGHRNISAEAREGLLQNHVKFVRLTMPVFEAQSAAFENELAATEAAAAMAGGRKPS